MSIAQISIAELLREHVTLEVESIDRMYLNIYIPNLQRESGASWFLKQQRKYPVASSAAMAPISRAFVEAIETYAKVHQVPVLTFAKGQRKDDVVAPYLRRRDPLTWEALVGGRGLRVGKMVFVDVGEGSSQTVQAEIIELLEGSERLIKFSEPIEPYFSKVGNVPLPPYIHEKLTDPERYQTIYAKEPGSAAAPTAGLHFTPRLLEELQVKGVKIAYVTLHVGLDTFAPVTEDDPETHKIHTEWCELSQETADLINQTKQSGGRVVAVGTTSVRTLESAAIENRKSEIVNPDHRSLITAFSAPTSLFILPGYQFKIVDVMITNFHLPKSTLLMLVSAFAGREKILETYEIAIKEGYRFYSFGDAMLIL